MHDAMGQASHPGQPLKGVNRITFTQAWLGWHPDTLLPPLASCALVFQSPRPHHIFLCGCVPLPVACPATSRNPTCPGPRNTASCVTRSPFLTTAHGARSRTLGSRTVACAVVWVGMREDASSMSLVRLHSGHLARVPLFLFLFVRIDGRPLTIGQVAGWKEWNRISSENSPRVKRCAIIPIRVAKSAETSLPLPTRDTRAMLF